MTRIVSLTCTPATKRHVEDSMRAAPTPGLTWDVMLQSGAIPAAIRPSSLAKDAVCRADILAAIIAAGGIQGWDR